ncbi:MAG: pantoate kinase [Methanoregula sp.]|jgi:pantoate kinase|nr:pantoate kinase [Methanoregula sp.]
MSVTACCPGHISGYFKRVTGPKPGDNGSIGAGIVINPGVVVSVTAARRTSVSIRQITRVNRIRQYADRSPPIESALRRLGVDMAIVTECHLPVGAGFGLSAAALLATLTAANRLADLGMDPHEIACIAHETEVEHRTGLGDVSACQDGGRVVRSGAGIDGEIRRYNDLPGAIYAVSFGPIHTPAVLSSPAQMDRVARAFPPAEPATADEFFAASRMFARKSGLVTSEVDRVLRACAAEGVSASMTMLGNGVFAYGAKAHAVLRPFGHVYRCEMAETGARIVGGDV